MFICYLKTVACGELPAPSCFQVLVCVPGHGCGVGGRIVRKQLMINSVPGGTSLTARGAWSLGPASCLDSASSDLAFTLPYHF